MKSSAGVLEALADTRLAGEGTRDISLGACDIELEARGVRLGDLTRVPFVRGSMLVAVARGPISARDRLSSGEVVCLVFGRFFMGGVPAAGVEPVRRLFRSLEPIVPFPSSTDLFCLGTSVGARELRVSIHASSSNTDTEQL